jgi:hypothetical protein
MEKQKMIDVLHFVLHCTMHIVDACHLEKKMDMSTVIMYNQDCADLCRLTAQLLERKSDNADIFKTALVMCEIASECENIHKWSIAKMWEACRKCAEMCHE